jgi:radical SAM superfamily enzyme YgiQ (UPF0313 family)
MRILLINPPWEIHGKYNIWRSIGSIMPPLGLAWLAAVLELDGHKVRILDAHAQQFSIAVVPAWVNENGPFDLVGITATTPLISNALLIARLLKRNSPFSTIVLGGVHPTVLPEQVLQEPAVDVVVRGEGELTIRDLASGKPLQQIDGISFRTCDSVERNPDRELVSDLDSLPFPAYHLLPMDRYRPAAGAAKRLPASSVLATRGCPGKCTFCYRIFGSRLRVRSGRNVAQEVRMLHERYKINEICFYDDTFTVVGHEVRNFCAALQEMKLHIHWSCFSRIDNFDESTFRAMKQAGCHQVMYGIESGDPEILRGIKKRVNADSVEYVVRKTKEIGIEVRAAFILGNPGETEFTLENTIRYAIDLNPDLALFNIATPYPGTEMFEWAEKNNYLITKNWDDYNLSTPVMELPTVSSTKVLEYYKMAHRRFLLRPKYIWNRLKRFRNKEEMVSTFRVVLYILKSILDAVLRFRLAWQK